MKIALLTLFVTTLFFSGSVLADENEALFKMNNCSMCHSIDSKVVGPALKSIAAKYRGDETAQARLEAKVRSGGNGSFGTMKMPGAGPGVSDSDIKKLVTWILSIK